MTDERLRRSYEQLPDGEESREKLRNRLAWEAQDREGKRYRAKPVNPGRFAAVPAMLLLIFVLGVGWFFLQRMGPEDDIIMTDPSQEATWPEDGIYQASLEWYRYVHDHEVTNPANLPGEYLQYGCMDMEMVDKLDSICEEYGLRLETPVEVNSGEYWEMVNELEIGAVVQKQSDVSVNVESCSWWGDLHYHIYGTLELQKEESRNSQPLTFYFFRGPKTELDVRFWSLGEPGEFDVWTYTAKNGEILHLYLKEEQGIILKDGEDYYMYAQVSWDKEITGEAYLNRKDLEMLAECFDFSYAQTERTMHAGYVHILDLYLQAQREDWDAITCQDMGVNYVAITDDHIGYILMDVDGDGNAELLIGNGDVIYDMYSLYDGKVLHALSGRERNVYYYCVGGYIGNRGSSGAGNTVYNFYRLEDGGLVLERNVTYDAERDEAAPWTTYEGNQTCGLVDPITEERAYEIINSYVPLSLRLKDLTYRG